MVQFHFSPRKSCFVLTALCLGGSLSLAQTTFEKTYDGLRGSSVHQTCDGGYIMTGFFDFDPGPIRGTIYLVKTNSSGDTLWTTKFGGATTVSCVCLTFDGGYIITGSSVGNIQVGGSVAYLVKFESSGKVQWKRYYAFNPGWPTFTHASAVQQTPDGGYVIAGDSRSSICLLKIDASGDSLWMKRYGSSYDEAHSVQLTSDGGYIVAGYTNGSNYYKRKFCLLKTDASGDTLWTRTYGQGRGNSAQQTSDGGYIAAGSGSLSGGYGEDSVYLLKTGASGDLLWARTYGKGGANSVQQTSDGGYIIAGVGFLLKTNSSGDTIWTRRYVGSVLAARQTSDGGYIISGGRDSSGGAKPGMYLVKTDANGLVRAEHARNLVQNPGFESGKEPWKFFREGSGGFSDEAAGGGSPHAAKVAIVTPDRNLQLYQCDLPLKARTRYRLSFKGYSRSGSDLQVFLHKHSSPYTSYGLSTWDCNLTSQWRTFMCEFTSTNFDDSVDDGRLRFWFAPFAAAGDEYVVDDVELVETEPHPLINGDFEWDESGWDFFTDGTGSFDVGLPPAGGGNHVGHVMMSSVGANTQLYQSHVELRAGEQYRLSFKAFSQMSGAPQSTGTIGVYIHMHGAPYGSYGLDWGAQPLWPGWNTYSKDFVAQGFEGRVDDGRLRFWFSPFARAGEEYFIDDVTLERVDGQRSKQALSGTLASEGEKPNGLALFENYPNPFNPWTQIGFRVAESGLVKLAVYNLLGQEVAQLVNGEVEAGYHEVRFDAAGLPSGVYFCRMNAGRFVKTMKMIIAR